ncbi:hypothetical protein ACE3NQ_16385 [Paenibacillus terreus]|uniref:Uncharacterized protein n=1 Tax=Paenibacillus terreus TaxID=1387834 RepID=A0ABV5B9Y3_9BACL
MDEELNKRSGIPFEITAQTDPFYNPANMKRLKESIQQMEQGKMVRKSMSELEPEANE